MKLLPLTTRKQLLNPHRASHQVSKSTHLCVITHTTTNGAAHKMSSTPDSKIRSHWKPSKAKRLVVTAVWLWKNKEVILTCQWSQGLRAFRSDCHNFSCHSTGWGVIGNSGFNMHFTRSCPTCNFLSKSDSEAAGVKKVSYPSKAVWRIKTQWVHMLHGQTSNGTFYRKEQSWTYLFLVGG